MPPKLAKMSSRASLSEVKTKPNVCVRCSENGLECNVNAINRNLGIECTNCADYRFQYDPNFVCTIQGRAKPMFRTYSQYHPQLFTPNTSCERCIVDKRAVGCDVDNILNYSCSRCRGKTCQLTDGRVMDTKPNLRQGFVKWFRHACDACHNINISRRHTNVNCSWLDDRGGWKEACHRCEDMKMACYHGGMLTGLAPLNGPEIRNWESKALISGGWSELRPHTSWRKCCDRCRVDGAICRASNKWPLAACNRCTAMGIDCMTGESMYPIRDLGLVGWGSFMAFHSCRRCVGQVRNCDRQRPCDMCVAHGEAHLCDDIRVRTPGQPQRSTNCFRTRLKLPPGPLYYLAMGYGPRGVNDVKTGSRLCHWIGALLCIHSKAPQNFCRVTLSNELEKLRREMRPRGRPPVLTKLSDMPYLLDMASLDYAISLNWKDWYIPGLRHDYYERVADTSEAGYKCALKDFQLEWRASRRAAAAEAGTVEEVKDAEEDSNNNSNNNNEGEEDQNANGPNDNDGDDDGNDNGGPGGGGPGDGGSGNGGSGNGGSGNGGSGSGGSGNGGAGSGNGGGGDGGGNSNGNNGHNSNNNSNNNSGQDNDDDDEDDDQDAPGELVANDVAMAMDIDQNADGTPSVPATSAPPATTTTTTTAAANPTDSTGTAPNNATTSQSQQYPGLFQTGTITEAVMAGFTANRARHNANAAAQLLQQSQPQPQSQSQSQSQSQGPNLTTKVAGMAQNYLTSAQTMSLAIANTSGQGQGQTQGHVQTHGQAQGQAQGQGLTPEVAGMAQNYLTSAQNMSLAIANTSGQGQAQGQGQGQGQTQGQSQGQSQGQTQGQAQTPAQAQSTDEERAQAALANTPAAILEEARVRAEAAEQAMANAQPSHVAIIQATRDSGVPIPPEWEPEDEETQPPILVPQLAQPPHPDYQQTQQRRVQQATQRAAERSAANREADRQARIQEELDEQAAQQAAQQGGQQPAQQQQAQQQPVQQQPTQQGQQQPAQQPGQQQPAQQARQPTRPQLKRRGTPSVVSSHPTKRRAVGQAGASRQAVAVGAAPAVPLSPDRSGSGYPDPTRLASHNPPYGTADGTNLPQPAQMTAQELEEQDRRQTEAQLALLAQATAMDTQVTTQQSDADMIDVDDTAANDVDDSNIDPALLP